MNKEAYVRDILKKNDREEPHFTITISGDNTSENVKKAKTLSKGGDEGSTGIERQTWGAK